jgi:hypothetical protein
MWRRFWSLNMRTHNHDDDRGPGAQGREEPDASNGFERSDVRVSGVLVFLTALSIFVIVTAVLCYGVGKVLFAHMAREDQPKNKWATTVDVRPLGDMPSNPEMQSKLVQMTQQFPTPRLQTDDGSQETADLHAREDLLLEHYSWANQSQGKVRIPIERAMELIAQRGLPVAPKMEEAQLLTGDSKPVVAAPLTGGFARTGYEQDEAQAVAATGKRK